MLEAERKYQKKIDVIKGIAIIMIVWTHLDGGSLPGIFGALGKIGGHGVQFFMVIAGYLAISSYSLIPNKYHNWIKWIGLRFLRLVPLYYISMIGFLLIVDYGSMPWLGNCVNKVSIPNIIMHILLLHTLNPYYSNSIMWVEWYIGTLFIFYCLTPLIYRIIKNSRRNAIICASIIIIVSNIIAIYLKAISPLSDSFVWYGWSTLCSPLVQIPGYILGVLLYYLPETMSGKNRKIILLLGSVILILTGCLNAFDNVDYLRFVNDITLYSISALFIVWFFKIGVDKRDSLNNSDDTLLDRIRKITGNLLTIIGQNSYGIYLTHYLLVYVIGVVCYKYNLEYLNPLNLLIWWIVLIVCGIIVSKLFDKIFGSPLNKCRNLLRSTMV